MMSPQVRFTDGGGWVSGGGGGCLAFSPLLGPPGLGLGGGGGGVGGGGGGGGGREVVVENLSHLVAHRHSRTTTAYCLCKIPLSPAAGVDLLSRLSDSHSSPGISFMNLSHFNKVYYTILSLLWNKHRL